MQGLAEVLAVQLHSRRAPGKQPLGSFGIINHSFNLLLQGLAEVLAVQSAAGSPLENILSEVLAGTRARNAAVREGHLTLFRYLPRCVPDEFQQYLPQVGD